MDSAEQTVNDIATVKENLIEEISKCVVGQNEVIEYLLISIFSAGHCILHGLPGLAKTLMISSLAKSLNMSFNRIQFTPDLMPSDITGTEIIEDNSTGKKFKFIKGPIFNNIILADEINRTPPKTQSALLQAMQEYKVTSYGNTYELNKPFFVFATENPIEQEGTYPLPEAQIDRFFFNIEIDYPDYSDEVMIAKKKSFFDSSIINPVMSSDKLIQYQSFIEDVPISDKMVEYIVKLVSLSRPKTSNIQIVKEFVNIGAGPRASQYIVIASKSNAILNGKFAVTKEDIKKVLYPVLNHRIILNYSAYSEGITNRNIIEEVIKYADKH